MAKAVFAFMVDVKAVMCVLDAGHCKAPAGDLAHQAFHQAGFAVVFPADDAKDFHDCPSASNILARAISAGVLTLKNGSKGVAANSTSAQPC